MKRWLIIFGCACCCLGFITPVYQTSILRAATSLETALLWVALLAVSFFVGVIACALAIPNSNSKGLQVVRSFWVFAAGILLLIHGFYLVTITGTRFIAPKATLVVPNGYSGILGIYIQDLIEPSIETAGKAYAYKIPSSGALRVDSGWIAVSFSFDLKGFSAPDAYITYVLWENGTPLRFSEFLCDWVQDSWMEQTAAQSWSSRSKTIGIACNIKPGEERETKISHDDAERFFRNHFVIKGLHNPSLQLDAPPCSKRILDSTGSRLHSSGSTPNNVNSNVPGCRNTDGGII